MDVLDKVIYPCRRITQRVAVHVMPLADLLARAWLAYVFFSAGLVKLQSWETTLLLFTYEYQVPLLSPDVAALFGTAAEIILPILLLLGLGGRFFIFLLFGYNLVAMISYPFLWTPDGEVGLQQHIAWGLMLLMLACHGAGRWSLDAWLLKRLRRSTERRVPDLRGRLCVRMPR